jgi:hypothetical protein
VPFIQEIFEPAYAFFIHCFGVFMHKNSACHGGVAFFGRGCWLVFKNMFREMDFFSGGTKCYFCYLPVILYCKHLTLQGWHV